jgi:hypothetical protein
MCMMLALSTGQARQAAENVGTKIVRHDRSGGTVTTYILGGKRRTEFRNAESTRRPDGTFSPADPPPNVVIDRCDLGQSFGLDVIGHRYAEYAFTPKHLTQQERQELGLYAPDWDTANVTAYREVITTVDTGERQEIFGELARHVITTTRTTLMAGGKTPLRLSLRP